MKPASLLLLLSVLSSQLRPSAGRPLLLGGGASAGDGAAEAPRLLLLREDPEAPRLLPAEEAAASARRTRSEEPPLSIDLTFHLLRNMIQMARMESQRARALLNRRVLDEVGK